MSLIGQIWLKLFLVLVMAFLGSVAVHTDACLLYTSPSPRD